MSSMSPPPPQDFQFCSESNRILSAHRRHLFGLSALFLLPLISFCNSYFHIQSLVRINSSQIFQRHHSFTTTVTIILPLVYYVIALFLSLSVIGSISFSVYHFGRPVKLISALRPHLFVFLVFPLLQFLIFFVGALFQFLMIKGFEFLVLVGEIEQQSSPHVYLFCLVVVGVALAMFMYLPVSWALVYVIVVLKSILAWGFEPLRQSTKLFKRMRRITLFLMLVSGFSTGYLVLLGGGFLSDEFILGGDIRSWKFWSHVWRIVSGTATLMLIMLQFIIIKTVLNMHCKGVHGEVTAEEEFEGGYASVPSFDDDDGNKVPYSNPLDENDRANVI